MNDRPPPVAPSRHRLASDRRTIAACSICGHVVDELAFEAMLQHLEPGAKLDAKDNEKGQEREALSRGARQPKEVSHK